MIDNKDYKDLVNKEAKNKINKVVKSYEKIINDAISKCKPIVTYDEFFREVKEMLVKMAGSQNINGTDLKPIIDCVWKTMCASKMLEQSNYKSTIPLFILTSLVSTMSLLESKEKGV